MTIRVKTTIIPGPGFESPLLNEVGTTDKYDTSFDVCPDCPWTCPDCNSTLVTALHDGWECHICGVVW